MVEKESQQTKASEDLWPKIVKKGIANAVSGLAQMVGQEISSTSSSSRRVLVKDIPDLFGGVETEAVMVYLGITGTSTGHMAVIYPPKTAFQMVDLLMGLEPGSTKGLEEMAESALAEMGNIIGSFFLNALVLETGLDLRPSPPAVMFDMVGAILDIVLAEISAVSDDVMLVETTFGTADQQIDGTFLVMPSPELMDIVLKTAAAS